MQTRKKKRHSGHRAFVVTFAVAASACGGAEPAATQTGASETAPRSLLGISDRVRRTGDICIITYGDGDCPEGARCNPPPPEPVACPPELVADGVIARGDDGTCTLIPAEVCELGPMPTCNPPPPRPVPCVPSEVDAGLTHARADGTCTQFVAPSCPQPTRTCTQPPSSVVACPGPRVE